MGLKQLLNDGIKNVIFLAICDACENLEIQEIIFEIQIPIFLRTHKASSAIFAYSFLTDKYVGVLFFVRKC